MDARLIELAGILRQNGLRVSPAELTDAAAALAVTGMEDRETVRGALAATLVKSARDHAIFDEVFDLYFSAAGRALDALEGSLLARIEEEGLLSGDELEMILFELRRLAASPLARALIEGDSGQLTKLLRGAALQLDLGGLQTPMQTGFYARRMLSGAGLSQAEMDVKALEAALRERGLDPARLAIVSSRIAERLRALEAAARRMMDVEVRQRVPRRNRGGSLEDRPFNALSREEIERTAVAVRRLAEKLKSRLVRRQRSRRKGSLSVRRTLRRNLGWGGVPARLVFRRRRPERPDVVVLCDVSDSVRNVSRLMLLFVHTLQSLFQRVRSFAFVSDLGEITELLRGVDAAGAVDLNVAGEVINLHANSNYGRALALFARNHLGSITRRTTVLVIGDGRSNYHPPEAWALRDIQRKARRVIWICPEDEPAWSLGDSEMPLYSRSVGRVVVVQTLSDLEAAAERIVPV
jgi:uncharacterized protein with von Willebrand factor type A (vWA) domain